MSRAQLLSDCLPIALALADFLRLCCQEEVKAAPNGRHRPRTGDLESKGPQALIQDARYTVNEAAAITGKTAPHLRKMISEKKIESLRENGQRLFLGKHLMHLMIHGSDGSSEEGVAVAQ